MGHDTPERPVVELGGGVHVELAREMDLLLHARQRELHVLALEQAPGGAVLLQPAEHALVGAPRDPGRDRPDRRTRAGEHDHRLRRSVSLSAHDPLVGDEHLVKCQFGGGTGALAHLVLDACDREPLALGVDQKAGPGLRRASGIGCHQDRDPARDAAVGDEPLCAAQAKAARHTPSVACDPGAAQEVRILHVRAGFGLGDRACHQLWLTAAFGSDELRQHAIPL